MCGCFGRQGPHQFRTIKVCAKDLPTALRHVQRAGIHACYLSSNLRPQGDPLSEQVVEERRGWASDIVWVVLYSMLVLLVMLLWVYVPA
jgi:hypothetical protein